LPVHANKGAAARPAASTTLSGCPRAIEPSLHQIGWLDPELRGARVAKYEFLMHPIIAVYLQQQDGAVSMLSFGCILNIGSESHHLMPRAIELSSYRSILHVEFKNVFARISSFKHFPVGCILEYWHGSVDCFLDRCDHRGFSSPCVSIGGFRERGDTTESIDHVRFQCHGRVFDDPGLVPAGSLPEGVQYFRRILRWNAFGTGLIGDDDTGVRKCPAIVTPQISSTISAKKNSMPLLGRIGAFEALWRGVGGKVDRSICAKK
jgi:hypothetical protein